MDVNGNDAVESMKNKKVEGIAVEGNKLNDNKWDNEKGKNRERLSDDEDSDIEMGKVNRTDEDSKREELSEDIAKQRTWKHREALKLRRQTRVKKSQK